MSESFTIAEFEQGTMPQALPLLRATWPGTHLAAWQGFADAFRDHQPSRPAITGLFDSSGGLCGLFASHIEPDLCEGQILGIPLFTAVDIGNSLEPIRALLDAARGKARDLDCSGVRIRLADEQSELFKRLRTFGVEAGSTLYIPIRR